MSENTLCDAKASRHVHRRDYIYSLDRGKRYTVLLRRLFSWFEGDELMALGYLLSLASREHPSITDMATDLSMSTKVLKRTLESLKSKQVLFQDFVPVGNREKSLWHISHPCRWEGSDVSLVDSIDPATHEPRTFSETVPRINEARDYILSQPNTIRVPNILFRVHIGWRARYLWAWLSQLPDDVNPSISQLAHSLKFNWRTIREGLDILDDAGMIVIEGRHRKKFGGWACLYFHLTDLHDWKFEAARETYPAPRKRSLRAISRYSAEEGWHDRRASFEPQYHCFQIKWSQGTSTPSISSAFEPQRLHFSSAEAGPDLHSGSVFSNGSFAHEPQMSSFQGCRTAQTPAATLTEPFFSKGFAPYNKASIIKAIEKSREEKIADASGRHLDSLVTLADESERKPLPMARIISIADSVSHVFVSSRNRKCDPALWTDTVIGIFKSGGESVARQFVRFVAEVFIARGQRPIAYNSIAVEDLSRAFLSGRPPSEIAGVDTKTVVAQEAAVEWDSMAHDSLSSEKTCSSADDSWVVNASDEPCSAPSVAYSEPHRLRSSRKESDRLRNVPQEPGAQRWFIHRMWPKLIKSQKAALQSIWLKSDSPEKAIRDFATLDEDSQMKVISAAAEVLETGIFTEAPLMPWETPPAFKGQKSKH